MVTAYLRYRPRRGVLWNRQVRYYGLDGEIDAALYWLLVAAEKEGVNAAWAEEDSDLALVRRDPRWRKMRTYLRACAAYWERSGVNEHVLIVPEGYDGQSPIPVVIGLHGMGGRAKHFLDEDYQDWANDLNVAFLAISGTIPCGPHKFVWSESPERDARRIEQALEAVNNELRVAPGKIMLYGFSQGALASVEIATRNPDRFAGALLLSPGGRSNPNTASLDPLPSHRRQGYVAVCGAQELPGNVAMAAEYARDVRRLQARVIHKPYPNVNSHAFPPDFEEQFPTWIRFVLSLKAEPSEPATPTFPAKPKLPSVLRMWSAAGGKSQIEAEAIRLTDDQITLRRSDGREVTVPISKLNEVDQEFIQKNLR